MLLPAPSQRIRPTRRPIPGSLRSRTSPTPFSRTQRPLSQPLPRPASSPRAPFYHASCRDTPFELPIREFPDPQGNFVWLPIGGRTDSVAHALEQRGVVVCPFSGEGIRVTIGTPEENDRFLATYPDVAG